PVPCRRVDAPHAGPLGLPVRLAWSGRKRTAGSRGRGGMSRRLLAALATAWLGFAGSAAADTRFSADEVARILRHGPWPPPISADVSNRASGRPDAAALGEALFFDLRLSGTGGVSCASCHRPDRGWSDGRATAAGIASVDRNTPGL